MEAFKRHFKIVLFAICIAGIHYSASAQNANNQNIGISIEWVGIKPVIKNDSLRCVDLVHFDKQKYLAGVNTPKGLKFTIKEDSAILISILPFLGKQKFGFCEVILLEPGDNVSIRINEEGLICSGRGAAKIELLTAFHKQMSTLIPPSNERASKVIDLDNFWEWNAYINQREKLLETLLQTFTPKLNHFSLNYLKAQIIGKLEYERILRFATLEGGRVKYGVNVPTIKNIFNQIFSGHLTKWLFNHAGPTYHNYGFYEYARQFTLYQCNFDNEHKSVTGVNRTLSYYNAALHLFKGYALQNCLTYLITDKGIKEHTFKYGYVDEFEKLLSRYFHESTRFPNHVAFVKKYDDRYHRYLLAFGQKGFNFNLSDENGSSVTRERYKGRLLLINFWNPENEESTKVAKRLSNIIQEFNSDSGLAVVNVSTEKDKIKWIAQVKKNHLEKLENLFTNGLGDMHPVFKAYGVLGYPKTLLLDANGRSLFNPDGPYSLQMYEGPIFPNPLNDNGKELIAAIRRHLAVLNDGPYVFDELGNKLSYIIKDRKTQKCDESVLFVQSDVIGKKFKVQLQRAFSADTAEKVRPDKLLAMSDIEGNFDKLRLLLQSNGVIDTAYNWSFGSGHLVFSGDMFDRGIQVTECLWLLYSLEEKAKVAGGKVHFILGNHEIMNLQGDHRYVDDKYKTTAEQLGKSLTELYGNNSELGRWLRTKNIVEKIGDLLFVHGGLSPQINRSSMSVSDMNKLARPYYANKKEDYGDTNTNLVMSQTYGPFWYRGYYENKINATTAVDSILTKYNAKHIVTGHTIVADTISVLYKNKVINTDVPHAKGKSEALLVEGNYYYRVNDKGQRWLLFNDEDDIKAPATKNKNNR